MEKHAESELAQEQVSLRLGRGTRDQISNLRRIMEVCHEFQHDLVLCFIDCKKAFDSVDHNRLWAAMLEMGFPKHLINLIKSLYDNQEATVRTACGETANFGIEKFVRHGCILNPVLFNLYAEMIMRKSPENWKKGI